MFDHIRRWYEQWRRPARSGRVDPDMSSTDSIIPTLTVVSTLESHREHMPHPTPPHHHTDVTHTHSDSGAHSGGHSDGGGGHSDGGGAASH